MSDVADPRAPKLGAGTRRNLVHGGFTVIALLYVGLLVLAPLAGIAWAALKAGWPTIAETLRSPDVLHAYQRRLASERAVAVAALPAAEPGEAVRKAAGH